MTSLEVKLASMVVHLVEAQSQGGHAFDIEAAKSLMLNADVAEILAPSALIPHTRSGRSVAALLGVVE